MYKRLKFDSKDRDNLFFLSDLHHGHHPNWEIPIWKTRGFSSFEAYNEGLINKWNSACNDASMVFHLGDFIFSDPDGEQFKRLIRRLNFRKLFLFIGNHTSGQRQNYVNHLAERFPDAVTSDGKLNYEVYPLVVPVDGQVGIKEIVFMPTYAEISVGPKTLVLCHYPIASWNEMAKSSFQLAGHSHLKDNVESDENPKGKFLNVGIESLIDFTGGAPIGYRQVEEIMNKKQYVKKGHH
jgi:calcineurin-like phosphoesterase family protein